MYRFVSAALLTAALALGGVSAASAASGAFPRIVERSGRTFHVQACPGRAAPGWVRCHAHVVTDSLGNELKRDATGGPGGGFGPADLRAAYNITGTGSQATVVAIVDAYGYPTAESDLAVYRAHFGLPPCTTANGCFAKYNERGVMGSYPTADLGWSTETALDLDMVSAMCPNCKIILVEADVPSLPDLAAAVNTAARLGAHVISNSYGGPEGGSQFYESAYNHPGVAITVSSGDAGYGVQFPASSPHVIAVGGTTLIRSNNARGWSETAWSGAGSGCSTIFAKPSWQTDPLCAYRMEADVSAVADPATPVAIYAPTRLGRSFWITTGGTSVAAPLVAGIYGVNGGVVTLGSLYSSTSMLQDVTSGSNGSCGGTYLCTSVVGYDGPTGLGTPNGTTPF
jgi:hypothetical protein